MKVSNAPGGKSNFSLGWGQEDYEVQKISNKKQFGNQNQQSYNIFGQEPIEKPSIKVKKNNKYLFNIFFIILL